MDNRTGLFALLLLFPLVSFAQDTREVQIKSDSLRARQIDGRTVFEMLRPVLTTEDSRLTADNGLDEGNGYVRFWGNVEIVEKADTIRADRVRYHKDTKVGLAEGNVSLSDGDVFLQAPSATHFSDEDLTIFEQGVQYSDSTTVLSAEKGTYRSDVEFAAFSGHVQLQQESTRVRADSLTFDREREISRGWGSILVEQENEKDSTRTFLMGDTLYRNAKLDSMRVSGNTQMALVDFAQQDTLFILAASMDLLGDDELIATDSVTVSSSSYAMTGNSLKTTTGVNEIQQNVITGSPQAWMKDTQVVSDTLRLISIAESDSIFGTGSVFLSKMHSKSGRIQQLKGERLALVMNGDSLRSIVVEESAEAVLFFEPEEGSAVVGFRGSGDGMRFSFEGGELNEFAFYEGVEGTYYAENLLDQLLNLSGYIWEPDSGPDHRRTADQFWAEYQIRSPKEPDEDTK